IPVTWLANDSSGGTFSISLNGNPLETNLCTGTTSFPMIGCNGQAVVVNSGRAFFTQLFAGDASGTNTLTVTVTSATGEGNPVTIVQAATIPTSAENEPFVGVQGVLRAYTDANRAATAAYNT